MLFKHHHIDTGASDTTSAAGFHGTTPQISIDNPSITEGNGGFSNLVFTVALSNPSSQEVTVCYDSAPGSKPLARVMRDQPTKAMELLRNRYRIFLTRGVLGTYIYLEDEETSRFFADHLGKSVRT